MPVTTRQRTSRSAAGSTSPAARSVVIGDVAVHDAGRKGKGVFALRDFRTGEFIFRRRHGKVVTAAQIRSLYAEDRRPLCERHRKKSAVALPPWLCRHHA